MKKVKVLLLSLCAVLLVAASVLGTLAYLTSQDTVVNTFTVGKVKITLDEADVHPDGTAIPGASRVKSNEYHLVPGQTYLKDPTMTVKKGSEESYVRMMVTINCLSQLDAAFAPSGAALTSIFNGYDATEWVYEAEVRDTVANTITYEFRYKDAVNSDAADVVLDPLFDSITVPAAFDAAVMDSIADLKITVVGHAIQKTGFADDDAAWTAFAAQVNP